jgi:hypothetical protein
MGTLLGDYTANLHYVQTPDFVCKHTLCAKPDTHDMNTFFLSSLRNTFQERAGYNLDHIGQAEGREAVLQGGNSSFPGEGSGPAKFLFKRTGPFWLEGQYIRTER